MYFDYSHALFVIFNYFSLVDVFLRKIKFNEICFLRIRIHFVFLNCIFYQIDVSIVSKKKKIKKEKLGQNGQRAELQNIKNKGLG